MHPADSSGIIVPEPPIITTNEWGAKPPRRTLELCGRPSAIIVHATDGHHPEISLPANESRAESIAYAKAIQHSHTSPSASDPSKPWSDSGHNFLVCRNGLILVGRHQSYTRIKAGLMVVSAHCPGENTNPGIEFEHKGNEGLTDPQFLSGVKLMAWIASQCGMSPYSIYPHRKFFPTACPTDSVAKYLPEFRTLVYRHLRGR